MAVSFCQVLQCHLGLYVLLRLIHWEDLHKEMFVSVYNKPRITPLLLSWYLCQIKFKKERVSNSSLPTNQTITTDQNEPSLKHYQVEINLVDFSRWGGRVCVCESKKSLKLCLWDLSVVSPQGGRRAVLGSLSAAGSLGFRNARKSVFSTPIWWFLCCCGSNTGWELASETGTRGVLQWKIKAAISVSTDSYLFSQGGCHLQPTHPIVSQLELALNKRDIVNILAGEAVSPSAQWRNTSMWSPCSSQNIKPLSISY